jgi:hypothetical protein
MATFNQFQKRIEQEQCREGGRIVILLGRMPIADEIAAVLNELVCRELMPFMMAGLIDS